MSDSNEEEFNVTLFIVVAIIVLLIWLMIWFIITSSVKIVKQAEVMIIERFGRYKTTLKPGLHFIIPFVETPRRVHWRYLTVPAGKQHAKVVNKQTERIDMREHVIDFGRQHVITKDTVSIDIDALVYFQITDAELAVFKIQNLPDAVELLTQTTLRNIIAQMTLDDTFSSRDAINRELMDKTAGDAERWGVSITRVEIQNILPPSDIERAMQEQIREERERRSTVLRADGERESEIVRSRGRAAQLVLRADGEKTSMLHRAKGQAESKVMLATAESEGIKLLRSAITDSGVRATDYLVALQYMNTLQRLSQGGAEVVMIPNHVVEGLNAVTAR